MMIVVKNDIETGAGAAAKQGVGDDNKQCAPPLANNDSNGNIAGVASSRPCTTARQFLTGRHDRHDRSSSSSKQQQRRRASPWRMSMLIIAIGCLAGTIILAFGIQAARHEQEQNFKAVSGTLFAEFGVALSEYVRAGQWIHQAFRRPTNSSARPRKTLDDFNELYENLVSGGLQFNGVGFGMNVSHAERPELENETRLYLQEKYPELAETYTGFLAVGESSLEPRENASFYMIAHYVGSMQAAGHALDVDVYTHPARQKAIDLALATWKPIVTAPIETGHQLNSNIRSVVLVHPGMPLATNPSVVPRDLSLMGIRIPHVIDCARLKLPTETHKISLYVFDSTTESSSELDQGQEPIFLGGATLNSNKNKNNAVNTEASSNTGIYINATSNNALDTQGSLVFASEIALSTLLNKKHCYHDVSRHAIASREWTFLVMAEQDEFAPEGLLYIVLSAVMIFVACTSTALWVYTNHTRLANIHDIQCKAAADKAEFMVESARKAARDERWLNDFISHEIRNPCAAAISACSFVSSAVHEAEPLVSEKARASVREDVKIIETSLSFINDLLRNMLDMHRAASHQLIIDNSYVDILEDILQPVATMLYRRDCLFEVLIDCPPHLICRTDRLRLKQIVINISRNAAKFVHKGFVRFRVETKGGCTNNNNDNESGGVATAGGSGNICIYVEDSGPGIPESKRGKLFEKFQESLDSQNQGTGIGLCVCKHLVELMGGEIWLDETYDSGIAGCPGTRFVIELKVPPLPAGSVESSLAETEDLATMKGDSTFSSSQQEQQDLPHALSVLIVDDEMILRKLFHRSIKKAMSDAIVAEASNGETALRYVDEGRKFDLIFMDQYMSGVERCMLGTETVRALRAKGVECIITGLSANDIETAFLEAGANAFTMKPFPCQGQALKAELLRIWNSGNHHDDVKMDAGFQDLTESSRMTTVVESFDV